MLKEKIKNNKIVIGITINNILRDHLSILTDLYLDIFELEPVFPINPYELDKSFITKISPPILNQADPFNEKKELIIHEGSEDFEVYQFMYIDASFEVFGRCEESIPGIIRKISEFANKDNKDIEIILLNQESPRSKNATLFFLSKNNFDLNTINFPTSWESHWDYCDVLITDHPKILIKKPKNKIAIKVQNEFNIDSESDLTIISINEIFDIITENKETWKNKKHIKK